MTGIYFDFGTGDIVIASDGSFGKRTIDNQNCALIALSQICRLTNSVAGAQIGSKIINRKQRNVAGTLAEARRMVEVDGGTDVTIGMDENDNLFFEANYGDV